MRCPRCKAEVTGRAASCPGCGAPLALRDEPPPAPLRRDLALDRRSGRPRITPPIWPAAPVPLPPGAPDADIGFEILGPIDDSPPDPAGDTAPGPPPPAARPPAAPAEETAPGPPPPSAPARERPRDRQAALPFPPAVRQVPAPPGRRALSWAVDGALAAALAGLLTAGGAWLAGGDAGTGQLPGAAALAGLLHFAHATLGHALAGRTLGKWAAGLALVGPDGRRPAPGRSAARALLSLAAAAPLGLGLLPALLGRRRRAIHDLAAGTAVIRAP